MLTSLVPDFALIPAPEVHGMDAHPVLEPAQHLGQVLKTVFLFVPACSRDFLAMWLTCVTVHIMTTYFYERLTVNEFIGYYVTV